MCIPAFYLSLTPILSLTLILSVYSLSFSMQVIPTFRSSPCSSYLFPSSTHSFFVLLCVSSSIFESFFSFVAASFEIYFPTHYVFFVVTYHYFFSYKYDMFVNKALFKKFSSTIFVIHFLPVILPDVFVFFRS